MARPGTGGPASWGLRSVWGGLCISSLAGAFRWLPTPGGSSISSTEQETPSALRPLRDLFLVPDNGSPVQDTMMHIASLSQGDRLWFERCEVTGHKVLAPHENATDGKPSALSIPALRRRFRCDARAAFEFGELLLALEADRHVIAYYADRADREGLEAVCRELRDLVVELDLVEGGTDPVDDADDLPSDGDDALESPACPAPDYSGAAEDDLESDLPVADGPAPAAIGYHVVGDLFDDEDADLLWEASQPDWYRSLLDRIARADTLDALAAAGHEIRSLSLSRDQAAVAWTAWRLRRTRLEATLPTGKTARGILARIGSANPGRCREAGGGDGRALARLGTWLYRAQRVGSLALAPHEWRAIWSAYHTHRAAQPHGRPGA